MGRWLGIDFGTSNTSAAAAMDGTVRLLPLEAGQDAVPTAVFLDFSRHEMLFGSAAVEALVMGREGRFLRALKRVLGTPLMREPRQLLNQRMTLVELVGMILARIRERAEAETGEAFTHAVAGRPVRFQADPARDAQAAVDLGEAYALAGFESVDWLAEPEAAALACGVQDGLALVVDIGGGTSDFSLFRARAGAMELLGSEGVRIGGTDADRTLSLAHVMPLLGQGSLIRAELGSARHPAPAAPFNDLATWEKIGFLHTAEMLRKVRAMARLADEPEKLGRLVSVFEHQLGFDIAFAVEAAKIAANGGDAAIDLDEIEPGLAAPLTGADLGTDLGPFAAEIARTAGTLLTRADTRPEAITHLVYVGGSSLLAPVRRAMEALCPAALPVQTAAFTAVAEGLARRAAEHDGLAVAPARLSGR